MPTEAERLFIEDRAMRAHRVYRRLVAHGLPDNDDSKFACAANLGRSFSLSMSLEVAEALADKLDKLEGVR